MSRYIADYTINKPDDLIKFIAEDFLTKEGFRQTVYKAKLCGKKGWGPSPLPSSSNCSTGRETCIWKPGSNPLASTA